MTLAFHYDYVDCQLVFGELRVALRAAARFETQARARVSLPFGSSLWPSALALCELLAAEPELCAGRSVLELGCGLGLCSIVAHRLGGDVLATDGHPDMSELFAHNARMNALPSRLHSKLRYAHYDWRHSEPPGRFALVIASDVLYESAACTLVADVLARSLAPGGLGIVTDPGRPHLPRFFRKLEVRGMSVRSEVRELGLQPDSGTRSILQSHATAARKHRVLRVTAR